MDHTGVITDTHKAIFERTSVHTSVSDAVAGLAYDGFSLQKIVFFCCGPYSAPYASKKKCTVHKQKRGKTACLFINWYRGYIPMIAMSENMNTIKKNQRKVGKWPFEGILKVELNCEKGSIRFWMGKKFLGGCEVRKGVTYYPAISICGKSVEEAGQLDDFKLIFD